MAGEAHRDRVAAARAENGGTRPGRPRRCGWRWSRPAAWRSRAQPRRRGAGPARRLGDDDAQPPSAPTPAPQLSSAARQETPRMASRVAVRGEPGAVKPRSTEDRGADPTARPSRGRRRLLQPPCFPSRPSAPRSRKASSPPHARPGSPPWSPHTTAVRAEAGAQHLGGVQEESGAGLPWGTSRALNIRPSNRTMRPARVSVVRIFRVPEEATQTGQDGVERLLDPGTGLLSSRKASKHYGAGGRRGSPRARDGPARPR